jgi:hypothetical protein
MNAINLLAGKLQRLEAELQAKGHARLKFNQQRKTRANMSFSGGNGRLWIQPVAGCYDLSLPGHGKNLRQASRWLQANHRRIGKQDQPFWRVENFDLVREAVEKYARNC